MVLKRRKFLKTVAASLILNTVVKKSWQFDGFNLLKSSNINLANSIALEIESVNAEIVVDWSTTIAKTKPLIFGSNDYEIMIPERAADSTFQNLLNNLNIRLIRVHHSRLSENWTNLTTKNWDEDKIQLCYDASYSHNPQIVQTIPRWPSWMKQDDNGLLDFSEYDNYANFCGELVRILNKSQNRKVIYWEPFNELDERYKNAGQLDELRTIYNRVTERMKSVDSKIKIGGPVLTWDDSQTLNHFLESCSKNVDFISWHCYASGDANAPTEEIMSFTPKYGEQTRRFRSIVKKHIPNQKIPLYLSEYNINYSWDSGEERQNTHVGAVWFASVLKHLAESGIDMASSWHLKDGIYGMIDPHNNLRPSATVFSWANQFLEGKVMQNESNQDDIEALPITRSNGSYSLMLINKSANYSQVNLIQSQEVFEIEKTNFKLLNVNGLETYKPKNQEDLRQIELSPYSILLIHSQRILSD